MTPEQEIEEMLDLHKLIEACKTPEEAQRAGILVREEEFLRRPYRDMPLLVMLQTKRGTYRLLTKSPEGWREIRRQ